MITNASTVSYRVILHYILSIEQPWSSANMSIPIEFVTKLRRSHWRDASECSTRASCRLVLRVGREPV